MTADRSTEDAQGRDDVSTDTQFPVIAYYERALRRAHEESDGLRREGERLEAELTALRAEKEQAEAERDAYRLRFNSYYELEERLTEAEKKAALADEVFADECHFDLGIDDEARELCHYCGLVQYGDNVGRRPFPHADDCPKARYDAIEHESGGQHG